MNAKERMLYFIATGAGLGEAPIISGTFGTLAGIPVWIIFYQLGWPLYALSTIALLFIGVLAAAWAEGHFGKKDAGQIVIDEVVGFLVTMLLAPFTLRAAIYGFLLFRFFDIVKPFPARRIDKRLGGGWGVMLDDVFAGLYAGIAMQLLLCAGWI
ncbi:MAG: phosphatidylglycerophosphatase A [Candidatus Alcyoniella australis]|nr:phosphatidylglycerophosphatase A [Candidatus Alcyoniella australis]